ncbi:TIGR01459 family HAD-type hydrolase [Marinivivus vitaminiproducens]|uniref:TIGR01459 family HAD-type hydrolase n=1 Tax=Marinivivus vitaminiproducens TaxID=3035935 RepID=UPI0027A0F89F|nr:TIGR01459 family HAD-type hydrolase [Geminicoccaceae bacterium SCSIO 64248]
MSAFPDVPILPGISTLVPGHDGIVMDLWGVIHGGVEPYPGVLDALEKLKDRGIPVAFVSNAPRRRELGTRRLDQIGIPRELYGSLVTSGQLTHDWLALHAPSLGTGCYYVGPDADADLIQDLPLRRTERIEDADVVVVAGFEDESQPVTVYDPMLTVAKERGLTLVCANPDRTVRRHSGEVSPCAGLIAEHYGEMGGTVVNHGKPDAEPFLVGRRDLGLDEGARMMMIGDSLHTDIAGARAAGFTAVMVARGVHADDLGIAPGETPQKDVLAALYTNYDLHPDAVIATLRW